MMKYTYKRAAGTILIFLGISIVSRYIPVLIWNISIIALLIILAYLLYYSFYN